MHREEAFQLPAAEKWHFCFGDKKSGLEDEPRSERPGKTNLTALIAELLRRNPFTSWKAIWARLTTPKTTCVRVLHSERVGFPVSCQLLALSVLARSTKYRTVDSDQERKDLEAAVRGTGRCSLFQRPSELPQKYRPSSEIQLVIAPRSETSERSARSPAIAAQDGQLLIRGVHVMRHISFYRRAAVAGWIFSG